MAKCTNCGQECYYTQSPEIVFTDDKNIICEDCGTDFCETEDGTIRKIEFDNKNLVQQDRKEIVWGKEILNVLCVNIASGLNTFRHGHVNIHNAKRFQYSKVLPIRIAVLQQVGRNIYVTGTISRQQKSDCHCVAKLSGCEDAGWIEITRADLEECFEAIN